MQRLRHPMLATNQLHGNQIMRQLLLLLKQELCVELMQEVLKLQQQQVTV